MTSHMIACIVGHVFLEAREASYSALCFSIKFDVLLFLVGQVCVLYARVPPDYSTTIRSTPSCSTRKARTSLCNVLK
jgi:hypothetical protein